MNVIAILSKASRPYVARSTYVYPVSHVAVEDQQSSSRSTSCRWAQRCSSNSISSRRPSLPFSFQYCTFLVSCFNTNV